MALIADKTLHQANGLVPIISTLPGIEIEGKVAQVANANVSMKAAELGIIIVSSEVQSNANFPIEQTEFGIAIETSEAIVKCELTNERDCVWNCD